MLGKEEQERAKERGWRPQLGRGNEMGAENGRGKENGRENERVVWVGEREREDGGLPRTPGWVPKLTPTRRGDELFLSVA